MPSQPLLATLATLFVLTPTQGLRLTLAPRRAMPSLAPSRSPAVAAAACTDPRDLPGDPSLILNVNVALKDKKAFMKKASAAIVSALSKPETYVAVCVNDGLDIIWAGEDTPCALGCLYSIGSINQDNNGALTAAVCALLEEHGGIPSDRVYINFFDVRAAKPSTPPRARARGAGSSHPRAHAAGAAGQLRVERPDLCGLRPSARVGYVSGERESVASKNAHREQSAISVSAEAKNGRFLWR